MDCYKFKHNADLIIAAPLMYDALKAFDEYLTADYKRNPTLKKIAADKLEKALAVADGQI
jgi:hypothetical protein